MQLPFYIEIGILKLNPHLLFEVLAFFLGFRLFLFLRKKQKDPISSPDRIWILIGAALGALIGSRLLGSMENWTLFTNGGGEVGWLYYYTNKTIVGALLGGLFVVELTKKIIGVKRSSGDLFTFPLILGILIGRVGCFLMGIEDGTHGLPTEFFLGMNLGDGLLRHPTALYEIGFLGSLWIGLYLLEQAVTFTDGTRFKLFMVAYLIFRFLIEYLKPGFRFEWELTAIQMACLLGLIYYYRIFLFPRSLFISAKTIP